MTCFSDSPAAPVAIGHGVGADVAVRDIRAALVGSATIATATLPAHARATGLLHWWSCGWSHRFCGMRADVSRGDPTPAPYIYGNVRTSQHYVVYTRRHYGHSNCCSSDMRAHTSAAVSVLMRSCTHVYSSVRTID